MDTNNTAPANAAPVNRAPVNAAPDYNRAPYIPPEYTPISMWGYFGYQIVFAIPIIGFIVLVVLAISASNINLKNYARSYFCVLIIFAIIAGIVSMILVTTGVGAAVFSQMN